MSLRCIGVMILKQLGTKNIANVRMLSTTQKYHRIGEHVPNNYLDKSIINRYKKLEYNPNKVQATYLWIDGTGENVRLKDRVLNSVPQSAADLPKWSYDGSSTYQALGGNSDIILYPRAMYRDPFKPGKHDVIVICDTYKPDGAPCDTNKRCALQETVDKTIEHEPWFGIEQEYTLLDMDGRPFGWPANGFPEPQGPYYCGVGCNRVYARDLVESHALACLYAGIDFGGTNAEVMPSQWEYQVGPSTGMKAADDLWVSRYILTRIPEEFGICLSYYTMRLGKLDDGNLDEGEGLKEIQQIPEQCNVVSIDTKSARFYKLEFTNKYDRYYQGSHQSESLFKPVKMGLMFMDEIGKTDEDLRHHVAARHKESVENEQILTKLATMVEGRIREKASTRLVYVMGFMREDEVVRLIRYDWMLIVFGNKMCCKYTPHYQENMIRAQLRLSGRILFEIKKIDSVVTDFPSIYHVERYNSLVSAIKVIARFDPQTREFGAPAMASCAVTLIKQIGKRLSAEYIRLRDRENKLETDDFLEYMDTDIDISINKLVAETQAKMQRRKQQNIPTMEDIKKLIRYIDIARNSYFKKLREKFSYENWLKLAQLNMAWIIVFNRRCVGEVKNVLVEEFLGRQSIDDDSNDQMLAILSKDAKSVAKKFKRMKIRGKRGRTVPVLLTPEVDKAIQLLVSYRQTAGLSTDNLFLFELPSSSNRRIKIVDAGQALANLSILCGAKNPSSLRGTNLRKHMAITCVSLELNDALVSLVAQFMGHDEKIHRKTYRHYPIEREVVQIGQLLEKAIGKCDMDSDDGDDDDHGGNSEVKGFIDHAKVSTTNVRTDMADESMVLEHNEDMMVDEPQFSLPNEYGVGIVDVGSSKKKVTRKRWSEEEISSVYAAFAIHFKNGTLPTQSEIHDRQKGDDYPAILRSRSWEQIKAYINNQRKKSRSTRN